MSGSCSGSGSTVLKGHASSVYSVAWSPDGRQLASGGVGGAVHLWDVARGVGVATLEGHQFYVCSVAWSPDGRQLASGSRDQTVRLWEVVNVRN